MGHRLLGRDIFELRARLAAEGTAGAGEQDLVEFPGLSAHKTLEDRRVFGVHGNDLRTLLFGTLHHDLARADQGLFIGKGDALTLVDGGKGGFEADGTGNGGDHTVGLGIRCGLH